MPRLDLFQQAPLNQRIDEQLSQTYEANHPGKVKKVCTTLQNTERAPY